MAPTTGEYVAQVGPGEPTQKRRRSAQPTVAPASRPPRAVPKHPYTADRIGAGRRRRKCWDALTEPFPTNDL
jgi:hypothetical protein